MALTEETDAGLVLSFTINATNANENPLPLRDATYSVELDGRPVFTGLRAAGATLRGKGTQQIHLPAAVRLGARGAGGPLGARPTGLTHYRISGELRYVTPGALAQLLFDTGVRRPRVGFAGDGQVDLGSAPAAPPKAAVKTPAGGA